jgi:GNAT superfamily N-acetyltransferase
MKEVLDLRISFEPHNDGPKQFVINGVDNYNIATTGLPAYYPVQYYLRSANEEVLGGVLGQIWGGWLHISIVWVAEPARGKGHARAMVSAAEDYARSRGCRDRGLSARAQVLLHEEGVWEIDWGFKTKILVARLAQCRAAHRSDRAFDVIEEALADRDAVARLMVDYFEA